MTDGALYRLHFTTFFSSFCCCGYMHINISFTSTFPALLFISAKLIRYNIYTLYTNSEVYQSPYTISRYRKCISVEMDYEKNELKWTTNWLRFAQQQHQQKPRQQQKLQQIGPKILLNGIRSDISSTWKWWWWWWLQRPRWQLTY